MPRERLNRDRVLQGAVALADRSGIDALSMRALAQDLGVVPMALYKHVKDKDELLDGMVDVLIDEFEPPDPAPRLDENVQFTVYRPQTIRPEVWYPLLAFAHLAERPGEVVTKRDLLVEVWRQPWGGSDKTVDVHLSWLRRKLGETAAAPRYLTTVRGVGVRLAAPAAESGQDG